MTSFQPQIEIDGKWTGNDYRFATPEAALEYATTVGARLAFNHQKKVTNVRVVERPEPPNQDDDL